VGPPAWEQELPERPKERLAPALEAPRGTGECYQSEAVSRDAAFRRVLSLQEPLGLAAEWRAQPDAGEMLGHFAPIRLVTAGGDR
jgi:hypothetical protein